MLLITRPLAQSKNLESLLAENEIDFALFPAFEIKKSKPIALIEKYDVIIFISINAVNFAEEYFEELFISRSKVFAVGPVTANQLLQKKIKVDCYPKINASSEELLKMKELQGLSNARILIVRGRGGSETLKDNLCKSNQVDYFEVYERVPCELTMLHDVSLKLFLSKPDGVLMASSKQTLDSILYLFQSINP